MKILLKEDVLNLGYAGEVHKVADGYGRNYLIPRGLAVLATPSVLKQAAQWRERAAARRAELQAEYRALSARIEALTLEFEAKAGESGKLYGSVTTQDVVDQLNEKLGTEIDRRSIVSDPLRQIGEHNVMVRLSADFQPYVTVIVHAEGEEEEQEADTEEIMAEAPESEAEETLEESEEQEAVEA